MNTIVVVNGAYDWAPMFPGHRVVQTYLDRSRWLLERGRLWIVDRDGTHRPDAILWRLGAGAPNPMHRACLEMIRLSGVPCVNSAQALLRGYDRLGMLWELKEAGLPVIEFDCFLGDGALGLMEPEFPAVLKFGNLHGGDGKARVPDASHWEALATITFTRYDYATTEPFIDYVRDIRCLAVGDKMWAMERRGAGWRANVDTISFEVIEPPEQLAAWTRAAMERFQADVLGLDFLETEEGDWMLLESNDIPGVLGFPDAVPRAIARCVLDALSF